MNLCITVVSVRWMLGDKLHYFGTVKNTRNSVLIPQPSEFRYNNKDNTLV